MDGFAALVRLVGSVWPRLSLALSVLVTFVVGGALATGVAVAAGEVYDEVVDNDGIAGLDLPLLDWSVSTRSPRADTWVTWFTQLGGPVGGAILASLLVLVVTVLWRSPTPLYVMLPALAGALLITIAGKELAGRARPPRSLAVPPYEASASFPSGHALNATVLAGLTAYLLMIWATRRLALVSIGIVAATYAVAMGLSRVWLGHHWFTDVVAGWLLGFAWVLAVVTVHRLFLTIRRA